MKTGWQIESVVGEALINEYLALEVDQPEKCEERK